MIAYVKGEGLTVPQLRAVIARLEATAATEAEKAQLSLLKTCLKLRESQA